MHRDERARVSLSECMYLCHVSAGRDDNALGIELMIACVKKKTAQTENRRKKKHKEEEEEAGDSKRSGGKRELNR